jgi:MYXO-CTERM domain-containing protein
VVDVTPARDVIDAETPRDVPRAGDVVDVVVARDVPADAGGDAGGGDVQGGCGCAVPPPRRASTAWALLGALALAQGMRRRRGPKEEP